MPPLIRNLRFALRQILRHPSSSVAGILILGLGLGTSTAMFSFVDGLLLRPIPLPDLPRLATLWSTPLDQPEARGPISTGEFLVWQDQARTFDSLAALENLSADVSGDGFPERLDGVRVTGTFFATLGMRPLHGRFFGAEATRPGDGEGEQVVLSERVWRRRYGAARNLAGQTILLNHRSYTVVGIARLDTAYPQACDFWIPRAFEPAARNDYSTRSLEVVGRLRNRVSPSAAEAELQVLTAQLSRLVAGASPPRTTRLVSLRAHLLAQSEAPEYMTVVLLAACFLLALACANVANLQVAQVHGRLREFVVRAALGASRGRLIRHVLGDSILLSALGGVAGLVVAHWTILAIRGSLPPDLIAFVPGWTTVGLNARAFGFAAAASLLTGMAAGVAPALAIPQHDLESVMREGSRGSTRGGGRHRLRRGLVIVELALALVLLVACGLVVRTFAGLIFARQGFETRNVLTMRIALPPSRYAQPSQITGFFEMATRNLAALPGVQSAAAASTLPFYNRRDAEFGPGPGRPEAGQALPHCAVQSVSPDYFRTMQIAHLQGRTFGPPDTVQGQQVAIVSERIARECWPDGAVLQRQLWLNPGTPGATPLTVVGVVSEVRHDWRQEVRGTVYVPFRQAPEQAMFVMLRTLGNPNRQAAAVRATVRQLDAQQPLLRLKPLRQVVVESMAGLHITAGVLSYMGIASLLVAAAGVYSVMASSVSQRTREMGIRASLGARRWDLLLLVLGEGMRLSIVGIAVGVPSALGIGSLLRHAVFGVVSLQIGWIALLALLLLVIAGLACSLPAHRASRVDPLIVLRYE